MHLPADLEIDATLPSDAERVHDTAYRWIKLARAGTRVTLGSLTLAAPDAPLVLRVRAPGETHTLDAVELEGDFAESLERVFATLFSATDHAATLHAFAFQSSVLATL